SLYFLASVLGYIAVPIALGALATLPSLAAIKDTLWPKAAERRTILIAFAAPLILAALAAIAAPAELDPLWSMSAMTLLPVVLFASPLIAVNRTAAVHILAFAVVFPLLLLAASPVIAFFIHAKGVTKYASHYRLIAQAVEQAWRAQTNAPLHIVGGKRPAGDGGDIYFAVPPGP